MSGLGLRHAGGGGGGLSAHCFSEVSEVSVAIFLPDIGRGGGCNNDIFDGFLLPFLQLC